MSGGDFWTEEQDAVLRNASKDLRAADLMDEINSLGPTRNVKAISVRRRFLRMGRVRPPQPAVYSAWPKVPWPPEIRDRVFVRRLREEMLKLVRRQHTAENDVAAWQKLGAL